MNEDESQASHGDSYSVDLMDTAFERRHKFRPGQRIECSSCSVRDLRSSQY